MGSQQLWGKLENGTAVRNKREKDSTGFWSYILRREDKHCNQTQHSSGWSCSGSRLTATGGWSEAKGEINSYYWAQRFSFGEERLWKETIILYSFKQFIPTTRTLKLHFYTNMPQPRSKSKSQMLKSKFSFHEGRMWKSQDDNQSEMTLGLVITLSHYPTSTITTVLGVIEPTTISICSISYTEAHVHTHTAQEQQWYITTAFWRHYE